MTNKEKSLALEKVWVKKKNRKIIISFSIGIILACLSFVYFIKFWKSREVHIFEMEGFFQIYEEYVTYNYDYVYIFIYLLGPSIIAFIVGVTEWLRTNYTVVKIEEDYVTALVNLFHYEVYLNGKLVKRSLYTRFETPQCFLKVSNGVKVNISFNYYRGPTIIYSKDLKRIDI